MAILCLNRNTFFRLRFHGSIFNSQLFCDLGNIWTCSKRKITAHGHHRPWLSTSPFTWSIDCNCSFFIFFFKFFRNFCFPHFSWKIPRIKIGVELPQIILDIRTSHSVNWKTATILYDDIFGIVWFTFSIHRMSVIFYVFFLDRDTISRVANALSVESDSLAMSISLLKLNSSTDVYERRENIKKSLLSFPTKYVGRSIDFALFRFFQWNNFCSLFRIKFFGNCHYSNDNNWR